MFSHWALVATKFKTKGGKYLELTFVLLFLELANIICVVNFFVY